MCRMNLCDARTEHDEFNKLYHVDKHFYRFFYDNRERLKNSFIIIMGDHGLRFGRYRSSKFGSLEDNNPALLISVPEKLRGGRLTQILKENARQLITHYDLYATLNDIASVLPQSRFTDFSPLDLNTKLDGVFHGASLLRPLPTPRHCGNLRVPFEYCTCQVQRTRIYDDPAMLLAAANFVVDGLNAELEAANVSERCVPLTLRSESTLLDRITPAEDLYQIELVTEPNRGKFSVVLSASRQKNGTYEFARVSDEISRVNGYAGQSECVTTPRVRPICFCREKFAEDAKKRKTGRKG